MILCWTSKLYRYFVYPKLEISNKDNKNYNRNIKCSKERVLKIICTFYVGLCEYKLYKKHLMEFQEPSAHA